MSELFSTQNQDKFTLCFCIISNSENVTTNIKFEAEIHNMSMLLSSGKTPAPVCSSRRTVSQQFQIKIQLVLVHTNKIESP